MTREQEDRYNQLTDYRRFTHTTTSYPIDYIIRRLRPEFSEKLRQLFKEEQDYLNKQIEEL